MAYKALYRKYRPTNFDEVAGQKHIVRTLQNALSTNKIAHAYLFTGPRGTGKTSMAKLLAKALNCEEGIGHQCDKCSNCLSVIDGSHPDVIEIDAASNNGVDEVRDLIDKVKYSPIKGRYKVYIIDEVHMMTSGAFNALLKTLEEPPAHVVFILATTEPHKVLPTIVSRCQRYDFNKVDDIDLKNKLVEILNKENIEFEEPAVEMIVSLSDGGVRDALSILDQLLAYSGSKLQLKDVQDIFGLADKNELIKFLKDIHDNNTKKVLEKMDEFISHGLDIIRITNDLLEILKDIIIYRDTKDETLLRKIGKQDIDNIGSGFENSYCLELIDILLKAINDFKIVSNINSLFQVVLLKLCATKEANKIIEVINKEPVIPTSSEPKIEVKENPVTPTKINHLIKEGEKNTISDNTLIEIMSTGNKNLKLELLENWNNLNNYLLSPELGSYAELLLEGKPYVLNTRILVVEFQFPYQAEIINIIENQKYFQKLLESIFNHKILIYGLSRNETIRLQKLFLELRQLSKLPKIELDDINITIKGEN